MSGNQLPSISVLMPIYNQAAFVRRALESLLAQTFTNWELIIVDDGSTDELATALLPFQAEPRIRIECWPQNQGLGAALNRATELAHAELIAYLPADDLYYPTHLQQLQALLQSRPEVGLAYTGLRYGYNREGELPQELDSNYAVQDNRPAMPVLVQVAHRRAIARPWPTRDLIVSDTLVADQWRMFLAAGVPIASTGTITCEWVNHPAQRHKIIRAHSGGLSRYRQHYGVGRGIFLNFRPSRGQQVNERSRFGRFAHAPRNLPRPGGLRILLAGELGFNPERVLAFEEQGHQLLGLWIDNPETWDAVGPFPFGNIEQIRYDRNWRVAVREARPDLIYALLNWQALELIGELLDAGLGIPLVFHFKEGPFIAYERGLWQLLVRALTESAGQVYLNQECFEWYRLALGDALNPETSFILDGDLPKLDWMSDDWAPRLSAQDGEIHTVCPGRPLGLDPFDAIAAAGIHVHFYGSHFQQWFPNWTRQGLTTGYMHLHETVDPASWVSELSRYDAAWFHVFRSHNHGDLRRAVWDDLNLPARLGTFAAAGLPWILKDNRDSRVAIQSLAIKHDLGLFFEDFAELAAQLRNRPRLEQLRTAMQATRRQFAFDTHVPALIAFFQQVM